ncbi:hypothetical protein D9Q98_000198 [Chlorella vulgaris]|uniref:Glycosyltransferase 61 catalytic domain-containing protein n=1 Tax=Chlorella vulgaris TaxID=3077 RepID=A0A9D4TXP7_CHLVU|nr:hypothetical protein D9Q98_000198 [Chlorella vulgaris]
MGVIERPPARAVAVGSLKDDYLRSLSSDDSDSDDQQSPRWSLAAFNWQRRQHRHVATNAHHLPQLACGVLLAVTVLALLACGALRLAHKRQLHLEMWQEAAAGSLSSDHHPSPVQTCQLELDGSPWERHCQRLDRVCVDQGMLILYDEKYQQLDGRKAGRLPELLVDTSKIYEYPWRVTSSSEHDGGDDKSRRRLRYAVVAPGKNRRIPPLPLRPATAEEPVPYLQTPTFSSCTVPVLLYSSWRGNFFHIFKDMAAQVYSLLRRTPWHRHAKLVMVTPEGLRLTQPESQLLPPLSGLSVQSMADFSRRIAQEGQPELDPLLPPVSYEGGERRCFQTAFFCGRNLPMAAGLSPAEEAQLGQEAVQERLAAEVPDEPYSYGQALAAYLKQQRQQRVWQRQPTMPLPDAISLQQAAEAAGGGAFEQAASSGRLKIALMKRSGEGRQILNSVELMQRCNAWKYIQPGSNAPITAECYEVSLPDLASGAAAARQADVFVGMHGANLANSWMLRPGASVIEVTPYQFEFGRGAFVFSSTNSRDATSQLLWWVAVTCDPAASSPGPAELAGEGLEEWWPRDRDVRLPWSAVEEVLQQVVAAGGSQQRYRELYDAGLHRFNFDAAGGVTRGGRCPNSTP